jgi:hypothetical protein
MKALSLWQPWASLIAVGAKKYETRSWGTSYRGPLLICAAKRKVWVELNYYLCRWDFVGGLAPLKGLPLDLKGETWVHLAPDDLPFGKAVAIVDLVDCLKTENLTLGEYFPERTFGDFTPGRFAWKLENVRRFKDPFPVNGRQGLFEVPDSLIRGGLNRRYD